MIVYKSVSAGNEFFLVASEEAAALDTRQTPEANMGRIALLLCDADKKITADGVVFYSLDHETAAQQPVPPKGKKYDGTSVGFRIFNRDGKEAEISGNGMAGLTALMFYLDHFSEAVTINTKVGSKTHYFTSRQEDTFKLKIEIGVPSFNEKEFFPFLKPGVDSYQYQGLEFNPVSTGNPHAVVLLDKELTLPELEQMGRTLENASIFPQNANVELVNFRSATQCNVYFYERGVGRTLSSSTGSAAVFAVLQHLKMIQTELALSTGTDLIKIYGSNCIYIENSTKIVYKYKYEELIGSN